MRIIDAVFQFDGTTWFGLAAVVAMLLFYALEHRSPLFILGFAIASWMGSAYGYMRGSWPIGIVGGIWGCLALRKCWQDLKSKNSGARKVELLALVWPIRFIGALAVISGIVLLIVDSPMSTHLPIAIGREVAEAMPLLLVGVAYLAWLVIDRPPTVDLIKQILIAAAFILWGVSLLMPIGPWSRFVGALVIAIYVFDLAWLMEGNLRRKFGAQQVTGGNGRTLPECRSAGVCSCDEISGYARESSKGGLRREVPSTSLKPMKIRGGTI